MKDRERQEENASVQHASLNTEDQRCQEQEGEQENNRETGRYEVRKRDV